MTKKNQSTHIKIGDLGVQPKKWFLKNVAPTEFDKGLKPSVIPRILLHACGCTLSGVVAMTMARAVVVMYGRTTLLLSARVKVLKGVQSQ